MFDFSQLSALKELVAGDEDPPEVVENFYKGSMLNPGDIGSDPKDKKEIAKPFVKVEAKLGKKYESKEVSETKQPEVEKPKAPQKKSAPKKNQIWSEEEITDLPVSRNDARKTPDFDVLYRQKVGTEDVFLGLSGVDPSSANCQQILYKIQLPKTTLKEISMDITEKAMVLQTKDFYLYEHFQYKVDSKQVKAKFISDKFILELILPVIRELNF